MRNLALLLGHQLVYICRYRRHSNSHAAIVRKHRYFQKVSLFALSNRGDFSKLMYFLVEIMCQHFEIYFLNPCRFVNLLIPFVTHPELFPRLY
jgi:hypothetical protein